MGIGNLHFFHVLNIVFCKSYVTNYQRVYSQHITIISPFYRHYILYHIYLSIYLSIYIYISRIYHHRIPISQLFIYSPLKYHQYTSVYHIKSDYTTIPYGSKHLLPKVLGSIWDKSSSCTLL